jgi:hypothetical protein
MVSEWRSGEAQSARGPLACARRAMAPKVTIETLLGKRFRRFADRQGYSMLSSARQVLLLLLPPLVVA